MSLTDANGHGQLDVAQDTTLVVSALHFRAADLTGVRPAHELKTPPEVVLSLEASQCGLGNGNCGPGVLQKYAVPVQPCQQKVNFRPCGPGGDAETAARARVTIR